MLAIFDSRNILEDKDGASNFDYYSRHYAVGIGGLVHCCWHCVNNKDLRTSDKDSICIIVTGGGFAEDNIARIFGAHYPMLATIKAAQGNLVNSLSNPLSEKNIFIREVRVKVRIGGKPEWGGDKIAKLYSKAYDTVNKADYDAKKAVLIDVFEDNNY